MLRYLSLVVVLLSLPLAAPVFAQPDDTYAKQLQEYDRRVAEQNQGRWVVPAVAIAAVVFIVFYGQRVARRRGEAWSAQSRAAFEEASAQNKRMIELLESIERNTRGPGT